MASGVSGNVSVTYGNCIFKIYYEETYTLSTNTTNTFKITKIGITSKNRAEGFFVNGKVKVNGTAVLTMEGTVYGNYCAGKPSGHTLLAPNAGTEGYLYYDNGTSYSLVTASVSNIGHNADGSKSITVAIEDIDLYSMTYGNWKWSNYDKSWTVNLTTIPRASTISSASNVTLGNNCSITWTPASSTFKYKLKFVISNWSYTTPNFITPNSTASYTYTGYVIPLADVAPYIPNSASSTMTAYLYTYNGNSQIGSTQSKTFTVLLPSNVIPTLNAPTATIVNTNSTINSWRVNGNPVAIAGYTKIKISATATGIYGSTINSFSISGSYSATQNSSSLSYTGGVISTSGDKTFTVVAKDSRGRNSNSATTPAIPFYSYSKPEITSFIINRNPSNAQKIIVNANWSYSEIGSNNTLNVNLQYKTSSESEWHNYGSISRGTDVELLDTFSEASSYNFKLTISDSLSSSAQEEGFVSTIAVTMDFKSGGKGIGIGKIAETDALEIAFDTVFMGKVNIDSNNLLIDSKPQSQTEFDNGYYGIKAAKTAESYLYARQINGIRFNYNTDGIFDSPNDTDSSDRDDDLATTGFNAENGEDELSSTGSSSVTLPHADRFDGYDPSEHNYKLFNYASLPSTKKKLDNNYRGEINISDDLSNCSEGWYKNSVDNTYWYWDGSELYNIDYYNYFAPALDCSTFVSLVLRGIPYQNSPWVVYGKISQSGDSYKTYNTWTPSNIVNLYGSEGWEQTEIDYQLPRPELKSNGRERYYADIGISGYRSLRYAAEFAEYYYRNGYVVYDRPITTPTDINSNNPDINDILRIIKPGDLLFWSKAKTDGNGNLVMKRAERFRCVSHIAMAAVDTTRTIEVTAGSTMPNAIYYRKLQEDRLDSLTLIIRPDYRPQRMKYFSDRKNVLNIDLFDSTLSASPTPLESYYYHRQNLCAYPWTFAQKQENELSTYKISRNTNGYNSIHLSRNLQSGENVNSLNTSIKGSADKRYSIPYENCITLSEGIYELSGMENTGQNNDKCSLLIQLWDERYGWVDYKTNIEYYNKDDSNNPVWSSSSNTVVKCYGTSHSIVKFQVFSKINIRVILYIDSSIRSLNCDVNPHLVRVE